VHTNNAFVSVIVETDDAFICVIVHTNDGFVSVTVHMLLLQNDIILILCSFHLVMLEECTPGVTVNYESIFWDLNRTFPILASLCLQGLVSFLTPTQYSLQTNWLPVFVLLFFCCDSEENWGFDKEKMRALWFFCFATNKTFMGKMTFALDNIHMIFLENKIMTVKRSGNNCCDINCVNKGLACVGRSAGQILMRLEQNEWYSIGR